MTAHPKIDPDTGEMVFFAYMATGPFSEDVVVHKVDAEGILTESILSRRPTLPWCTISSSPKTTSCMPVMPITGSLERAMEGRPPFAWEPEKGVHIGILPRHGGTAEDIRWLEMDLCFAFHFMNGFDQDGVITIDACQFEQVPLFPTPDGESTGKAQPYLTRWTIDVNDPDARVQFQRIDDCRVRVPPVRPALRAAKAIPPRLVYLARWPTRPVPWSRTTVSTTSSVTTTTRPSAVDRYSCGQAMTSEALFVPASGEAAEGEGYLLSVVTSFETRTSSLFIFNALNVAQGPLAKVHLSHCVPAGFHGTWRPAG